MIRRASSPVSRGSTPLSRKQQKRAKEESTTNDRLAAIEAALPIINTKLDAILDDLSSLSKKGDNSASFLESDQQTKNHGELKGGKNGPLKKSSLVGNGSKEGQAESKPLLNLPYQVGAPPPPTTTTTTTTTTNIPFPNESEEEEEEGLDVLARNYNRVVKLGTDNDITKALVESDAGMVNPRNNFRLSWDLGVIMPLLVYLTVTMPFRLTFENEASLYSATFWFEVLLNTLFIADIFLNFRTGYDLNKDGAAINDAGIIEYDRWRVAVNYIKSWFLMDVMSGVPFSLLELMLSSDTEENVHLESVKTLKLLRFLRLGRLLKFEKILSNLDQVTLDILADFFQNGRTRSAVVMLKLIFCLCYATHLMACGFVAVGKAGDVRNMNNWLVHELRGPFTSEDTTGANGDRPVYSIYIASFYFCLTTMTSVGYGDIITHSNMERVYVIILEIIGTVIFATIVGAITSVVASMDMKARKTAEQLDAVASFVALRQFPAMHFRHFYSRKSAIDETKIFFELSTLLRAEVSEYLLTEIIGKHSFFNAVNSALWPQLLPLLRPMGFEKGETVCRQEYEATEMYVVINGRFVGENQVQGEDEPRIRNIANGHSINSLHVLGIWNKCIESVTAVATGETYAISEKDFMSLYSSEYSSEADHASLERIQRRELNNVKMDPSDESAPTEWGRPLYFSNFSWVEFSIVQVSGKKSTANKKNSWGRTLWGNSFEEIQAWVVVDLVDFTSGVPYNDIWRHKTAMASPKTVHNNDELLTGDLFFGETVRWTDVTAPFASSALRAQLFVRDQSKKDSLVGCAIFSLEKANSDVAALSFSDGKEKEWANELFPSMAPGEEMKSILAGSVSLVNEWVKNLPSKEGELDTAHNPNKSTKYL